jgi:thiamine biosynthesis lipoprotein
MQPDFSIDAIGTHLDIYSLNWTEEQKESLREKIRKLLYHFEQKYSRFIRGNWLDMVNITRSGALDNDGMYMMKIALQVARATGWYFDPTITGQLSSLWYGREEHINHSVWWESISIDEEKEEIQLKNDVILEFWWVGKWYLIDLLQEYIDEYYETHNLWVPNYLINFWWDIYGAGSWKIGLENPNNFEEAIGIIELKNTYLACSSGSRRKWREHHHLIDPHTGKSANEVQATFIEGRSWILTDAYATALAVMPYYLACQMLQKTTTLEGVILSSTGEFFQSSGSQARLFTGEL